MDGVFFGVTVGSADGDFNFRLDECADGEAFTWLLVADAVGKAERFLGTAEGHGFGVEGVVVVVVVGL